MRFPKQTAASRSNGARSRGPVTPEGQQISARNNTRHGLLAQTVVLDAESEPRFLALAEDFLNAYQPCNAIEAALVETMIVARWRQLRTWGLQKLAMDREISAQPAELGPPSVRAMMALQGDTPKSEHLLRCEIAFDRQFHRAEPPSSPYFPSRPTGHNWLDPENPHYDSNPATC